MSSERDKVVPYEIGFLPEAAVSGPRLLQTDRDAFLTFNAVKLLPEGGRAAAGTGIVEIHRCIVSKFGYPNDEALAGHPLYRRGLSVYGVFEVLGSSWIEQMTAQNRVCFPKTENWTERHFIFTFHDSTFECVADSLRASLSTEPYQQIHAQICRKVFRLETSG
jgi:hypothetical protein